jgi:hypothetical protein
VPKPTLDRIDPLASLLKAGHDFWNIVGVPVTQTQLPVTVVFTDRVDETLCAYKEPEVVTTAYATDLNLLVEWHLYRDAVLLSGLDEGPCERKPSIRSGESQVSTCSDRAHFKSLFMEKVNFGRL